LTNRGAGPGMVTEPPPLVSAFKSKAQEG